MTTSLFRQQVIDNQQTSRFGSVMIINPLSFKLLTFLLSLIVLMLISFAVWGQYTRKHTVTGLLSPTSGLITVYASSAGVVKDLGVLQEEEVSAGAELISIATRKNSTSTGDVQESLLMKLEQEKSLLKLQSEKQAAISAQKIVTLKQQITTLQNQRNQTVSQLSLEKRVRDTMQSELDRLDKLAKKKLVSQTKYDQQEQALLLQQSRIMEVQRMVEQLDSQLLQLPADIRSIELQQEQDRVDGLREENRLSQRIVQLQAEQDYVVKASADAVVTHVLVKQA